MKRVLSTSNFRIIKIILTILAMVAAIFLFTKVLEKKDGIIKMHDFLTERTEYDVFFLGTSHAINGIYPMELWDKYNITSYNLAGHSNTMCSSYWAMKNAFEYHKPKMVVVDCFGVLSEEKVQSNYSFIHKTYDGFPLSKTKIEAINDMIPAKKDRIQFLWDFSLYHARWDKIRKDDILVPYSPEKGAESRVGITEVTPQKSVLTTSDINVDTIGLEYLEKIIGDCQSEGIKVLLIYLPTADRWEQEIKEADFISEFADKKELPYVNFFQFDLLNDNTDWWDGAHVNPLGAKKITGYIGNYLAEKSGIIESKSSETIKMWDDDYKKYIGLKNYYINSQTNMAVLLMLLSDPDYETKLSIYDKSLFINEPYNSFIDYFEYTEEDTEQDYSAKISVKNKYGDEILNDITFSLSGEKIPE